jgi:hypothetical protein
MMNRFSRSRPHTLVSVILLATAPLAGCGRSGPERYEVSGSVSFAGQQISDGAIAFTPIGDTKGPRVGANIHQGQYHIDRNGGPVTGRHRVEIACVRKTGRQIRMGAQMVDQTDNIIPPKYSGDTSELAAEIQPRGKNVFDFDLKAE